MSLTRESIIAIAATCNVPTGDPDLECLFADRSLSGTKPEDESIYYRFLYHLSRSHPGLTMIELGARRGGASLHFLKGGGRAAVGIDVTNICDRRHFRGLFYYAINADSTSPYAIAAAEHIGGQADIVFIDTDHTYETTHREHEVWRSRVKPGGLMLFDDICSPEYGCTRFWNELAGDKLTLPELHPPTWGFGVLFC